MGNERKLQLLRVGLFGSGAMGALTSAYGVLNDRALPILVGVVWVVCMLRAVMLLRRTRAEDKM
jgi:hypothetical protein